MIPTSFFVLLLVKSGGCPDECDDTIFIISAGKIRRTMSYDHRKAVRCRQTSSRCSQDHKTKVADTAGPGSIESVQGR